VSHVVRINKEQPLRRFNRTRWRIILIGTVIAVAPVIGLNLLLWFHARAQGNESVRAAGYDMLALVEARLDDAMTALITLGMRNAHGCSVEQMERMGRAAHATQFISEITVIDQTGTAVCATNGRTRVMRNVSPENDTLNGNIKFSIVDFGNTGSRSVRFTWRFRDGWGFTALVPGERLIPHVVVGRLQANFLVRLQLFEGTVIASKLTNDKLQVDEEGRNAVEIRLASTKYPFSLVALVPNSAFWQSYRDLFFYGNVGGGVMALLIICGALVIARQLQGPERHIQHSLKRGQFIPYYQPVIDIQNGRLMGCEVLVRRRRPDGSIEGPGAFITLAESTGQIYDITRALMIKARDDLGTAYSNRSDLKMSFNLVAGHFDNFDIIHDLEIIFSNSLLKMSQITLEVTERDPLPNMTRARMVIAKLQELGARVALDDVGTGHSGLSYLLKLGIDQMKLDKMFVDTIGTGHYSAAIVDTLIRLADDLSLELIAEGVETFEQVQYLRERGVQGVQGFVFSPPLPLASFLSLIEAMEPAASYAAEQDRASLSVDVGGEEARLRVLAGAYRAA
jgi:sensor c-di-GMP phosphodiesterase-like protein